MKVPATLYVEGSLEEVLTLETQNVSAKGTFLLTARPIPEGVKVEVELHLPLSEFVRMVGAGRSVLITVEGRVVRSNERGIAVEFGGHYRIKSE